jgi:hypothetical protein
MSVLTVFRIRVKFGTEILYKTVSSKRDFHENRLSDSHTILKGISEFLPYFPYFLTDMGEIRLRFSLVTAQQLSV